MLLTRTLRLLILGVALLLTMAHGTIIRSLLKNNIAGPDINFQKADYPFDPDAGPRRSIEYQRLNGPLGEDAIEKVGLGEDGQQEERKRLQEYRDSIGALTYKVPELHS